MTSARSATSRTSTESTCATNAVSRFDDAHLPSPRNAVERGLLVDTVDCLSPKTPIVVAATTPVKRF